MTKKPLQNSHVVTTNASSRPKFKRLRG